MCAVCQIALRHCAHEKRSVGGAYYLTVLVDEANSFKWVFTHKTKDESATFIVANIEKFLYEGHKMKMLRRARDAVYCSQVFTDFLRKHHITDTPTSGYSRPESGHAERAAGVLKKYVQCML
jgi:hypothetical protein